MWHFACVSYVVLGCFVALLIVMKMEKTSNYSSTFDKYFTRVILSAVVVTLWPLFLTLLGEKT